MLVDAEVVDGIKPAVYYSRGEGGAFYSALAAEEELENSGAKLSEDNANSSSSFDSLLNSSSQEPSSTKPLSKSRNSNQAHAQASALARKRQVEDAAAVARREEDELVRDVERREAERNRKVNPRGGSAGFP